MLKMCTKCHNIVDTKSCRCQIIGCDGSAHDLTSNNKEVLFTPMMALTAWATSHDYLIEFRVKELDEILRDSKLGMSMKISMDEVDPKVREYVDKYKATHSSPFFSVILYDNFITLEMNITELNIEEKDRHTPGLSLLVQIANFTELYWKFIKDFCYGMYQEE